MNRITNPLPCGCKAVYADGMTDPPIYVVQCQRHAVKERRDAELKTTPEPRSLTLVQRRVLLAFMAAADDRRRQTILGIPTPDGCEDYDVWQSIDELIELGLIKIVPTVRLEMDWKALVQRRADGKAEVCSEHFEHEGTDTPAQQRTSAVSGQAGA